MNDRPPSGLEKLWMRDQLERKPRLGLSLERIVESGIELADGDGLAAVSMKRVAESLGFTTMSLYRHVASKDELLLLMHDSAWRPPDGLDIPHGGWREDLAWWTREQYAIMERHPWLDEVRFIERAGTPSQIAWIDLGLRALGDVQLSEYQKVAVLLLLSGYVSSTARLALTSREGAKRGCSLPTRRPRPSASCCGRSSTRGAFRRCSAPWREGRSPPWRVSSTRRSTSASS